ncbi:hypothetical protein H257_06991 [Aphanomyces astaci]|uniref:WW domain-containing protein n=1 Tax=Aphanomyces astaci TaxID=112090 RepID=W4GK82_APHAT|nr:hypothetical protein H257_06991 [Aphanomyces astaci]ETV79761.1 hypothetical protein H257_06991 [Aphanomyces astaci]|eukprot:XP_009830697.1 hypothetical protein H257_06991 [Aphanomyces astaci]
MSVVKKGIWTEHVDAASGRSYYFNLVHGRSYWELPEELKATVMRPLVEVNAAAAAADVARDDTIGDDTPALSRPSQEECVSTEPSASRASLIDPNAEETFSSRIQQAMQRQEEQRRHQHDEHRSRS